MKLQATTQMRGDIHIYADSIAPEEVYLNNIAHNSAKMLALCTPDYFSVTGTVVGPNVGKQVLTHQRRRVAHSHYGTNEESTVPNFAHQNHGETVDKRFIRSRCRDARVGDEFVPLRSFPVVLIPELLRACSTIGAPRPPRRRRHVSFESMVPPVACKTCRDVKELNFGDDNGLQDTIGTPFLMATGRIGCGKLILELVL